MEKHTEKPIKAEIKDGKLVIGNRSVSLEAINDLLQCWEPKEFANVIEDCIFSFAQLGSFILNNSEIESKDRDNVGGAFPEYNQIYYLRQLSNSLKKM